MSAEQFYREFAYLDGTVLFLITDKEFWDMMSLKNLSSGKECSVDENITEQWLHL